MSMRRAVLSDLELVKTITQTTISEIYPHYYPEGAVEFFLEHHSETNIAEDIRQNLVHLCLDSERNIVGTVTIKANEICRLFVLPSCQRNGYGAEMLDYAEKIISQQHSEIVLDASLPAQTIYHKRGYQEIAFHVIPAKRHDFLCYTVMKKQI